MSKSQQKREEIQQDLSADRQDLKPKYSYQCHGCTNVADLTYDCLVGVSILCQHCGMSQKAKAENYIALI